MTKKVDTKKKTTEEKTIDSDKVFDVAHPGESMPSATSRPVIITGRKPAGDPRVSPVGDKKEESNDENQETATDTGDDSGMIMSAPKKNRIEPLHTTITTEEDEAEDMPETQEESDDPKSADSTEEEDATQEIAEVASEVSTKKQTQAEQAKKQEETEKKQAEIEALVNNKQYFVPINAVQKQRSMRFTLLILIIVLLAIVGVFAAVDAGLVDIGIDAPTDFIQD